MAVLNRPVGAHVPVAGGLARAALPYLDAVRAEAVQVYVSNPRGWALAPGTPAQDELFAAGIAERAGTSWVHATLLVNLGSPTWATVERSTETLAHALRRARAIGASGVVFHAGSAVDPAHYPIALKQIRTLLPPLLDLAGDLGVPLLVEPSAGGGRSLAATVEDLGAYLDAVDFHEYLGVCFDTCHAYAAGHDLVSPGGMTGTLDALVATVGPGRLRLVHANDSKDPVGSRRDRHANIGDGTIGPRPFADLLRHPATAGLPVIVETPGENSGHLRDVATLRALRDG